MRDEGQDLSCLLLYVQYVGQRERKDQERFLYNIAARAAYNTPLTRFRILPMRELGDAKKYVICLQHLRVNTQLLLEE